MLAGVNGTDPFVLMPQFLAELKGMGFSGVQNFPTVGLFDGTMRQSFEETGMGFGLEVDMIALAHELDLLTTPYVFNPDEAVAMTRGRRRHRRRPHGRDDGRQHRRHLGADARPVRGRDRRHRRRRPQRPAGRHPAVPRRADLDARGRRVYPRHADRIHGFYGASSAERLPAERAIADQIRAFKALKGE